MLAIEAVLDDLKECIHAEGCDIAHLEEQLEAFPSSATAVASSLQAVVQEVTAKPSACDISGTGLSRQQALSPDSSERQHHQSGMHMLHSEAINQSMLCGTDRSLGDIDAVMQARGYR